MDVPVTVHEAMGGGTIVIPTVEGQVKLKVPPGSQSGQTLKLKEKGAVDPKTKKRGDLMVKLVIKVPKTDDREILDEAEEEVRGLDMFTSPGEADEDLPDWGPGAPKT